MSAMTHSSQHALLTSRISRSSLFLSVALSPTLFKTRTSCALNHSGLSSYPASISFHFDTLLFCNLNILIFIFRLILRTVDKKIFSFLFHGFSCKMRHISFLFTICIIIYSFLLLLLLKTIYGHISDMYPVYLYSSIYLKDPPIYIYKNIRLLNFTSIHPAMKDERKERRGRKDR